MNWLRMIWGGVTGVLSSTNVADVIGTITDLYRQRAEAQSSEELARIDAEIEVVKLQAAASQNLQGYWLTAWIRPYYAAVIGFYLTKGIIWDASLHLGTTDPLNGFLEYTAAAVVGFYFLTRPFEKRR